jgi:hypothetical protein
MQKAHPHKKCVCASLKKYCVFNLLPLTSIMFGDVCYFLSCTALRQEPYALKAEVGWS